jgi:hypothetical protein
MERSGRSEALQRVTRLAAAVAAVFLMGGMGLRSAAAAPPSPSPTFTPQNDDWKGTTLDLTKWHPTVLGDAQTETNGIAVNDGTIKITAGGFDFWNDNDNGMFLWQPANGDFQATIEVRTLRCSTRTRIRCAASWSGPARTFTRRT